MDENGNITHVYAKKTTSYVTEDGSGVFPTEDGTLEAKDSDKYYFTGKTITDANGNVTHVYAKVQTIYVDENGNTTQPSKDGQNPNELIEGYEIVPTSTDENGNVKNVKVEVPVVPTTSFVTVDGKELSPVEEGTNPSKAFEGYELAETKTANGNITNVYQPVVKVTPTTSFVTIDGTVLSPAEEGSLSPKTFEGYTVVTTVTDKDGNVTHIYAAVPITTDEKETTSPEHSVTPATTPDATPT